MHRGLARSFLLSIVAFLCCACLFAVDAGAAKKGKQPGFKDVIVVFHNDMWDVDHVDRFVRIFYTKEQVLAGVKSLKGFERSPSNKDFAKWVRGLKKPGLHVYGEGLKDLGPLVTRLLKTQKGWLCCGPMRSVLETSELKIAKATAEQLEGVLKHNPKFDRDQLYFQMQDLAHKVRIWIHQEYEPPAN